MQKIGFPETFDLTVTTGKCYSREAYVFLRDALDEQVAPSYHASKIGGCSLSPI